MSKGLKIMSLRVINHGMSLSVLYTIANYKGESIQEIFWIYTNVLDLYLFSDLIKRQLALSNNDEIEVDLFIVFPSPIL